MINHFRGILVLRTAPETALTEFSIPRIVLSFRDRDRPVSGKGVRV